MPHLHLQYPPAPEFAARHADLCVSAARAVSGITLDYTAGSLQAVDRIIEQMRADGVRTEQIAETLFVFGCYVGEVFVRNAGAVWRPEDETPLKGFGGFFMVLELRNGGFCNPIAKVFKRFENGLEDDLPYFYSVFAGQAEDT